MNSALGAVAGLLVALSVLVLVLLLGIRLRREHAAAWWLMICLLATGSATLRVVQLVTGR